MRAGRGFLFFIQGSTVLYVRKGQGFLLRVFCIVLSSGRTTGRHGKDTATRTSTRTSTALYGIFGGPYTLAGPILVRVRDYEYTTVQYCTVQGHEMSGEEVCDMETCNQPETSCFHLPGGDEEVCAGGDEGQMTGAASISAGTVATTVLVRVALLIIDSSDYSYEYLGCTVVRGLYLDIFWYLACTSIWPVLELTYKDY